MDDKRRDLPSWMLGGDAKQCEQGEFGRSVQSREKKKRTRVQRDTLYFMNEAELVDAAFRVLTEGGGGNPGTGARVLQAGAAKNMGRLMKTNRDVVKRKNKLMFESDTEGESSDCELRKKTYISETDTGDVAEKATLPYAAQELGDRGVAGVSERGAEDSVFPSCSAAAEVDQGNESLGASDGEALRLVREIFFT
ncbi:hypothetical protein SKAU_G00034960 [Synaphobranchus kaupii]|uniref:Uncharacterized protein n=1 Tax=Synaphobranchus kaupii TaxID=118154 RepID=A0A9Q1GFJ4_SYNKA|nr:hypothetical protein SKAU_G00034960 [Synaphobranchus kaupii]